MGLRIHVFGASGSGTTTLGEALAAEFGVPCLDTDRYFWLPTEPPFQEVRPLDARLLLLRADMTKERAWVSSGSLSGWGDPLLPFIDRAVFLSLDRDIRMARLIEREKVRYGPEALAPGGRMHEQHREFVAWAGAYDSGGMEMRSRLRHEAWLASFPRPVLRLDSAQTVEENLATLVGWLSRDVGEGES